MESVLLMGLRLNCRNEKSKISSFSIDQCKIDFLVLCRGRNRVGLNLIQDASTQTGLPEKQTDAIGY